MDEGSGLTYQQMRTLIERFDRWSESPESFQRTSFTFEELALKLRWFLQSHVLDAESFDLLMAISCAIEGRHHAFKLVLKRPPANGSFQSIKQHELWASSKQMADEIDIAVANGEKSESAIAEAMARYGLSRPEVFRRLQQVRACRELSFKAHLEVEAWRRSKGYSPMPLAGPDGYIVTEDGKLARASR